MAYKKKKPTAQQLMRKNEKKQRRKAVTAARAKAKAMDTRPTFSKWLLYLLNAIAFFVIWTILFWCADRKNYHFSKVVLITACFTAVELAYSLFIISQIQKSVTRIEGESRRLHRIRVLRIFWSNCVLFIGIGLCMGFLTIFVVKSRYPLWMVAFMSGICGGIYGVLYWSVNQLVIARHRMV
ncbi:MAG: hypothetical protein IKT06_00080 [Aeriscardovia sp.]|nr:hypothetical protein [Aeriscardovia sp.]